MTQLHVYCVPEERDHRTGRGVAQGRETHRSRSVDDAQRHDSGISAGAGGTGIAGGDRTKESRRVVPTFSGVGWGEDLNDGQRCGSVRAVNPFRANKAEGVHEGPVETYR